MSDVWNLTLQSFCSGLYVLNIGSIDHRSGNALISWLRTAYIPQHTEQSFVILRGSLFIQNVCWMTILISTSEM